MTARTLTVDLRLGRRELHIDRVSRVLAPLLAGGFALVAAIISVVAAVISTVVLTGKLLSSLAVAAVSRIARRRSRRGL